MNINVIGLARQVGLTLGNPTYIHIQIIVGFRSSNPTYKLDDTPYFFDTFIFG